MSKANTIRMFTYGILKYPRNIIADGGTPIAENAIVYGHKMYLYRHSYPITLVTGDNKDIIYGTLFDAPASLIINEYDPVEGYSPYRADEFNMYNRRLVTVWLPDGSETDAHMYIANPYMFQNNFKPDCLIKSGNYGDVRQQVPKRRK